MLHRHRRIHPRIAEFLLADIGSPVATNPGRIDQQNRHATTRPTPSTSSEHPLTSDRHDAGLPGKPGSRTLTGGDVSKPFSANNIVTSWQRAISAMPGGRDIFSSFRYSPRRSVRRSTDTLDEYHVRQSGDTCSVHKSAGSRNITARRREGNCRPPELSPCVTGPTWRIAAQLQARADTRGAG